MKQVYDRIKNLKWSIVIVIIRIQECENTSPNKFILAESFVDELFKDTLDLKESRFREPLDLKDFSFSAGVSSLVLLFEFKRVKYRRVLSEIPALSFGQSSLNAFSTL